MLSGVVFFLSAILMTICTVGLGGFFAAISWEKAVAERSRTALWRIPSALPPLTIAALLATLSIPILMESYVGYGRSPRHMAVFFSIYVMTLVISFLFVTIAVAFGRGVETPGAKPARIGAILVLLLDAPFMVLMVMDLRNMHWGPFR